MNGPVFWVHPVERYGRTHGGYMKGLIALGFFSRGCQVRVFGVIRTNIHCHLIDNAMPEVGGRIQMEIDEKKDTVELAAPSDTITDPDLADAMRNLDGWIVRQLMGKKRNRFDMVRRVAEAAQALIRAAEPTALDFAGDGNVNGANYQVVGGGMLRAGGGPGDTADLMRQMMGMLQPALATQGDNAKSQERRNRAAEIAELMTARKAAPDGSEGDAIRLRIDKSVQGLLDTLDNSHLAPDPEVVKPHTELDAKTLEPGWSRAILDPRGTAPFNWRTDAQGIDHLEPAHPDAPRSIPVVPDMSLPPGMVVIKPVRLNKEGEPRGPHVCSGDRMIGGPPEPMPEIPVLPGVPEVEPSLPVADMLAQSHARAFAEAASGIDMHIMPRKVSPPEPVIKPGSKWRHTQIPGHLATVLQVLPLTGAVHFNWDTGMGEHTDSYTRTEWLRNWEPIPNSINRGSVWANKDFPTHTVVVDDQRGDHTVLFHPSTNADDHRNLPETEFRSAYTPTPPVFGQEHSR